MLFATMADAEIRYKAQVAAGTWIVGSADRNFNGTIICRFQRPMSPTNPDYGAWTETDQDNVD